VLFDLARRVALTCRAAHAALRLGIGLYVDERDEHHVVDDDDERKLTE